MKLAPHYVGTKPLTWEARQAIVRAVSETLLCGSSRELIVELLQLLALHLSLDLPLEDIEECFPPPTSPNKALEAP